MSKNPPLLHSQSPPHGFILEQQSSFPGLMQQSPFLPPSVTADGTSWLASTNSTGKGSGLDKALFYVPTPKASSGKIGFLAKGANNTDAITDGFELMGKIAMHEDKDTGDLQTNFYAQATDTAGVWALLWNTNSTVDKKGTAVQMRTDQASTPNDDSS